MTPDSVKDALSQKFVGTWFASGQNKFEKGLTPAVAAEEAMTVVQPILDKLHEVLELLGRSKECLDNFALDHGDPGSDYHGVVWEIDRLRKITKVEEPADWAYLSRFSATPNEIHAILAKGLAEDVHLNYQRAIGNRAVAEACKDIRDYAGAGKNLAFGKGMTHGADHVDPANGGGHYPAKLIRLGHGPEEPK